MIETEPDVIMRVLDDYCVRGDTAHLAQRIHTALLTRRMRMLAEDLERRRAEGL